MHMFEFSLQTHDPGTRYYDDGKCQKIILNESFHVDATLKESIVEAVMPGTVGVYTTLPLTQNGDVDTVCGLHALRLVRCIASSVCKDEGILQDEEWSAGEMCFHQDVLYLLRVCLDTACRVMSDTRQYMVIIVLYVPKDILNGSISSKKLQTATAGSLGIDRVAMYVRHYVPLGKDGPKVAYILGPPRKNPAVKDTMWIQDREYLEHLAPADASEVLLCTSDGLLLEGLVTNIFIVVEGCDHDERVVQTAPVSSGVLWGTMRKQVLDACSHLSIPVEFKAPSMDLHHTWKEAFVTNSMRGVCPLDAIVCDTNNVWGLSGWRVTFEGSNIAKQISECLEREPKYVIYTENNV